jgi:hypothetical protein
VLLLQHSSKGYREKQGWHESINWLDYVLALKLIYDTGTYGHWSLVKEYLLLVEMVVLMGGMAVAMTVGMVAAVVPT